MVARKLSDRDYLKILAHFERDHLALAYAIFYCSEAAKNFEKYCLRHNYGASSYVIQPEDGEPLTRVVYWKKG